MNVDIIKRHAQPVPRYTSYPTATNFSSRVDSHAYRDWLRALPQNAATSLYVHVPFCEHLCWYCGCAMQAVRRREPVDNYMSALGREIETVADTLGRRQRVTNIHWGGGSPNILTARDISSLAEQLYERFDVEPDAAFAVEVDPRNLTIDRVAAFSAVGVNRVSIGVQDFDPAVQRAINRIQSFEVTKRAIDDFRGAGVQSVNIDLVYGLPHQTRHGVAHTIEQVISLRPDRIAVFGYAHIPNRIRHQALIEPRAVPGAVERYALSQRIRRTLIAVGYIPVGIDHFALAGDALARRKVQRNFQGYTNDTADAMIGLGASAIGKLPQGFVQNAAAAHDYIAHVAQAGMAVVRGWELTDDDRLRAYVIEELMCRFSLSRRDVEKQFGRGADEIFEIAEAIVAADQDRLFVQTDDGFAVTLRGRPFVRSICACFDAYAHAQHECGV